MIEMTEANRIKLAGNPDRDKLYGPACMGLPRKADGHLTPAPEIGDVLTATDRAISITDVIYDVSRNRVMCTCESQGQIANRNWGEIWPAIEKGVLVIKR